MNLHFLILFLSGPNFQTGLAPNTHTTLDMTWTFVQQQETNAMFLLMQLSNRIDVNIS